MARLNPCLLAAALALACPAAGASELDGHAAHEHGVAQLTVVLEDNRLELVLTSPADNLFGFEHAPRKPGEKAAVAAGMSHLRRAGLLQPSPEAHCRLADAHVDSPFSAGSTNTHRDLEATYRLSCRDGRKLTHLDAGALFRTFPRLKRLRVDHALPGSQGSVLLTPSAPRAQLVH